MSLEGDDDSFHDDVQSSSSSGIGMLDSFTIPVCWSGSEYNGSCGVGFQLPVEAPSQNGEDRTDEIAEDSDLIVRHPTLWDGGDLFGGLVATGAAQLGLSGASSSASSSSAASSSSSSAAPAITYDDYMNQPRVGVGGGRADASALQQIMAQHQHLTTAMPHGGAGGAVDERQVAALQAQVYMLKQQLRMKDMQLERARASCRVGQDYQPGGFGSVDLDRPPLRTGVSVALSQGDGDVDDADDARASAGGAREKARGKTGRGGAGDDSSRLRTPSGDAAAGLGLSKADGSASHDLILDTERLGIG